MLFSLETILSLEHEVIEKIIITDNKVDDTVLIKLICMIIDLPFIFIRTTERTTTFGTILS
jgi:hypothetical protein